MNQPTETYAEAQGKPAFDWNYFLKKPTRTKDEWYDAWRLAGQWVTCACGNQCDDLPRDDWGAPIDYALRRLGVEFHEAIADKHLNTALETLEAIEARSAYLLASL